MTGFTSDGASVMLGVKKGVAQRLKNDEGIAHLIDSHYCVAHKEALAMKDILNEKESSYFWSIEQKTKELVGFLALQTT
uniref:Uncharacterized protein n=1 Tax=Romanomermis culicivorax TaxID=13658 RepID=A0A915J868_ROMCU